MQSARSRLGVGRRLRLSAARRDGAGLYRRHPAALVHRRFGAGRARRAGLRLALPRQADDAGLACHRRGRRLRRRRRADRRAAFAGLLARRRQQGRHRARQHHGLFSAAGRAGDGDVLLERAVHRRDDRTVDPARPAVRAGDGGWRLFVSRLERGALPARGLRHHRACRHRQHAGVRRFAVFAHDLSENRFPLFGIMRSRSSSAPARPTPRNWRRRSARRRFRRATRSA